MVATGRSEKMYVLRPSPFTETTCDAVRVLARPYLVWEQRPMLYLQLVSWW
jgi:hypothetical protein